MIRERATQFGPAAQLAGVLSLPPGAAHPTACVLVTAGVTPKFGPFRLYALLARALAAEGYPTLRFDLGGVGESPPQSLGMHLRDRTPLEIGAAVRHAQELLGTEDILLGGLCSGATDALRYAVGDCRIRGVILIDPFSYETPGSRVRYQALRAVGRVLRAARVWDPMARAGSASHLIHYRYMQQEEARTALRILTERGSRVHFVYTGAMRERMNHPRQVARMFPDLDFRGMVTVAHFPQTEHTQYLEEDRESVVAAVVHQIRRCHPKAADSTRPADRISDVV